MEGVYLNLVYLDMVKRNMEYLRENIVNTTQSNTQRCIALVAHGDLAFSQEFEKLKPTLFSAIRNSGGTVVEPELHHTVLVIKNFCDGPSELSVDEIECIRTATTATQTYNVVFDRIIAVKTGVVLCGIPNIDVGVVRDNLRKVCHPEEPYHLDICHMTLFRWTQAPSSMHHQQTFLNWVLEQKRTVYATFKVNALDLVDATLLKNELIHRFWLI